MFRLEKKFFVKGPPPPPPVKGKIFDTRFGLIHVQTGKKKFCGGTPPLVKGKIFDTRFGLIHVQTGEKNFCRGTPPPLRIATTCYGYAAGGMPLAFTQEDFLAGVQNYTTEQCKKYQKKGKNSVYAKKDTKLIR